MDHRICCRCGLAKTAAASCICKHRLSFSGRIANNAAQPDDLQLECCDLLTNKKFATFTWCPPAVQDHLCPLPLCSGPAL